MLLDSVRVRTGISAPAGTVWRFLALERAAWWPDMHFEPVAGSPLLETWIENGRRRSATGVVTRCREPELLAFRWSEPGWEHPLDVVIRLAGDGSSTTLTLAETGFLKAGTRPSLAAEHDDGWRYHLARLTRVCESAAADPPARSTSEPR